jgi:hypothetical protein
MQRHSYIYVWSHVEGHWLDTSDVILAMHSSLVACTRRPLSRVRYRGDRVWWYVRRILAASASVAHPTASVVMHPCDPWRAGWRSDTKDDDCAAAAMEQLTATQSQLEFRRIRQPTRAINARRATQTCAYRQKRWMTLASYKGLGFETNTDFVRISYY